MFTEKQLVKRGKELSFLLRHDKESFDAGLIDRNGWRSVSELCKSYGFAALLIETIVDTNNKKRYEFSSDKRKIRARQGHSIPVDVELTETMPPDILYHGTSKKAYFGSIVKEGLKPMTRLHVHLSPDRETAIKVGSRHGEPYVILIDAKKMSEDGYKFYLSNNGVWLTSDVSAKYFII